MGNHCIAVRNDTTTFRRKRLNVWNFKASLEALDAFDQEITPSPDLLFLTVMQPDLHGLQVVRLLRSRSALDGTLALMLTQLHRLLDCLLYGSARAVMGLTKSSKDAPIHEALMLIGRGEARTQTPCLLPARSCANAGVSSTLSGVPASPVDQWRPDSFPFFSQPGERLPMFGNAGIRNRSTAIRSSWDVRKRAPQPLPTILKVTPRERRPVKPLLSKVLWILTGFSTKRGETMSFLPHSSLYASSNERQQTTLNVSLDAFSPEAKGLVFSLHESKGIVVLFQETPDPDVVNCQRLSPELISTLLCLCIFPNGASPEMLWVCSGVQPLLQQTAQTVEQTQQAILQRVYERGKHAITLSKKEKKTVQDRVSKLRPLIAPFHLEVFFKGQHYTLEYKTAQRSAFEGHLEPNLIPASQQSTATSW